MLVLEYRQNVLGYPTREYDFSPKDYYPEYPFPINTLAGEVNPVYDMVRELFITSKLDHEHVGTPEWNPLGNVIQPGNTVLIKPNWVESKNKNRIDPELRCLVTNPSVVRAVTDYVIIALQKNGRIILADAPMQGCELDRLFQATGYDKLFGFYKKHNINIEVCDLRKYSVTQKYKGVISQPHMTDNSIGSLEIDLAGRSMHSINDVRKPHYKVEDYPMMKTVLYHSNGVHKYEVNKRVLEADVVINMPKPKTHRLAGMTAAIKNFVGITYDKACLPHRMEGDLESGSGDAYNKHSIAKKLMSVFNEKRTDHALDGKTKLARVDDLFMKGFYILGSLTTGDHYRIGSWYGNDTIWRTAVDLNRIVMHCDSSGAYHDAAIRKVISIGDMIVSGEKEGPVGPTPKPLGVLVLSDNQMLFDALVCRIMGFSEDLLYMFNDKKALNVFGFPDRLSLDHSNVLSNMKEYNRELSESEFPDTWHFEPHPCWKGHIEKK